MEDLYVQVWSHPRRNCCALVDGYTRSVADVAEIVSEALADESTTEVDVEIVRDHARRWAAAA